jgi:hypothetical protein
VFKLVYVSRAAATLGLSDVRSMVERAQKKNASWEITGFLCLHNGVFLQYLEGEESAVRALYTEICCDSRHDIVRMVELGHQTERNFTGWQMRYLDDYYLGQLALENMLEGVLMEFGRGNVEERRAYAMANRLVGRIAELAH